MADLQSAALASWLRRHALNVDVILSVMPQTAQQKTFRITNIPRIYRLGKTEKSSLGSVFSEIQEQEPLQTGQAKAIFLRNNVEISCFSILCIFPMPTYHAILTFLHATLSAAKRYEKKGQSL